MALGGCWGGGGVFWGEHSDSLDSPSAKSIAHFMTDVPGVEEVNCDLLYRFIIIQKLSTP
jgi:hypothetical protein